MMTPLDSASLAIATPVGPSSGSMMRTLAPRLMSAVASSSSVASLPCALSIRYCASVYPASAKASFRYGWSKSTYRVDDVVSGRITPTCRLSAPLVANSVSGLNSDIVELMLTLKVLMLSPDGIVFEPLDVEPDEPDEPEELQPAARAATAARATQPGRRKRLSVPWPCERECQPPSLLLPSPIPIPLSPECIGISRRGTPYNTGVPLRKNARSLDIEDRSPPGAGLSSSCGNPPSDVELPQPGHDCRRTAIRIITYHLA